MNWPVFRRSTFLARKMAEAAETYIRTTVKDPKLRQALIPDYPVGGKRILISDDYYPTLNRENVELVTSGIDHLEEHAVVTEDGRTIPVDVNYATGFESTAFLAPMAIHGRGGRLLQDEWSGGARAYLGMSVVGFPNLFLMYGPNTNLGHNSIIFMIECQANYILSCLRRLMNEGGASTIDLRRDVMDAFDAAQQKELQQRVWASTGKSWYKNDAGRITNNWSGSTITYWWKTLRADPKLYQLEARQLSSPAEHSATGNGSATYRAA